MYSIADILVNPTKEDNYPTVNIESIACGTPIVTYNTGGCEEQVFKDTGFCCNNYEELFKKVQYCLNKDYKKNIFNNKECLKKIDSRIKYLEYIKMYEESNI